MTFGDGAHGKDGLATGPLGEVEPGSGTLGVGVVTGIACLGVLGVAVLGVAVLGVMTALGVRTSLPEGVLGVGMPDGFFGVPVSIESLGLGVDLVAAVGGTAGALGVSGNLD